MIIITNAFPKLKTAKDVVSQTSKMPRFRTPFDRQHDKESQIFVKSTWKHFYYNSSSLWAKVTWKMSPLVIYEILWAFVNTLTNNNKYPLWNCENLPLPIQMQLSKTAK